MKAMADAGVSKGGQRLRPTSTATTVRVQNGKAQVLNGPYAEVKEQLGGCFLIDAPDLDAAISWAARCPGAQYGAIEVRPIWEMRSASRRIRKGWRIFPGRLSKLSGTERLCTDRGQ
jgi:hypothetical protein